MRKKYHSLSLAQILVIFFHTFEYFVNSDLGPQQFKNTTFLKQVFNDVGFILGSKFCTVFSVYMKVESNYKYNLDLVIPLRISPNFNSHVQMTFEANSLLENVNSFKYFNFHHTKACSFVIYNSFEAFELVNRHIKFLDIFPGGIFNSFHISPESDKIENTSNHHPLSKRLRHVQLFSAHQPKMMYSVKRNWNLKKLVEKSNPGADQTIIDNFHKTGRWTNYVVATMYYVARFLNATLEIQILYSFPSKGKLPSGRWDDYIQPLVEGQAHIGGMVEPSYYPRDILLPSKMALYDKVIFYTALPTERNLNVFEAITHPFSFVLWMVILISFIIVYGVLQGSLLVSSFHHYPSFTFVRGMRLSGDAIMTVLRPIIDQSGVSENIISQLQYYNSWRIFVVWSLSAMLFSSFYKSTFISAFVMPYLVYPPKTFQELVNSSYKINAVLFTSNMEVGFRESNNSVMQELLLRTKDSGWPYGGSKCFHDLFELDSVCMGYSVVLVIDAMNLLTRADGKSMFIVSEDGILPVAAAYAVSVYHPDVLGVDRQDLSSSTVGNIRPSGTGAGAPGVAAALSASASGIDDDESLDPDTMPYFDYGVIRNVSTVVQQHAFILCRVHRMKDRSVSWIRKRDLHILTAGVYTYTTDQRFVVLHPEKSENWTLQIKYPQVRDSGVYECQVNTEPKISMAFHLSVIESRARIIGGTDIHVQSGSTLRLTCEVEHSHHDIAQVFWYHGKNIIDPTGMYGEALTSGIQIVTHRTDMLRSQLTIVKVRSNLEGTYTCSPPNAQNATVHIYIIRGEHPAERLQRGNRSSSSLTHLRSFEYFILYASLRLFMLIHSICIKDCVSTQSDSR